MRKNLLIVGCFLFIFSLFTPLKAENGKEKRLYKKANRYYVVANYGKAIPFLTDLVLLDPTNFAYNYKLGVSYYYSTNSSDKLKALPFFETALKNMKDTLPEIYYYLGRTYQVAHRFSDAIEVLTILKDYVNQSQSAIRDLEEIDNYIAQCKTAEEFLKTPLPVKITNLGKSINSPSADYAPAISADESILVFTSKRKGTTGKKVDDDGKYYEDVYISTRMARGDQWQPSTKIDTGDARIYLFKSLFSDAEKISDAINTRDHDASISLTADGKTLFLYRKSDLWKSERRADNTWTRPERLPEIINSKKYHEPSLSQSADGNTLFVVSERPGGFGGKDIYKSTKKADGTWGELENLGATVNTRFNEDSPFIHPDGKTLYFSSEGHKSIGGYDIFKTTFEDGKWTNPENIGYPINSAADDIFFVMNAKGDHAYFSSIQGENYGDLDIYLVSPLDIPNTSENLQAYLGVDSAEARIALIAAIVNSNNGITDFSNNGKVYTSIKINGVLADAANIKITEKGASNDTANYVTSLSTGQKLYNLPSGKQYVLTIESEGYPEHTMDLTIPEGLEETNYYQEIQFEDITEKGKIVGRKTKVYTSMLDMDSVIESNTSYASLPKEEAYEKWLKSTNYTSTSSALKVTSFTDYVDKGIAVNNNNNTNNNTNNNNANNNTTNEPTEVAEFKPILFDFAKAFLREESVEELGDIYKYLSENKNVKLEIYGHTDSKGSEQFNLGLSQRRAATAKKYFVDKGIVSARIKTIGKGEAQPIAPNENPDKTDNPEGRQLNRRVEFKIVIPKK